VKRIDTALPGVCILEPTVFSDERGYLFEAYRADTLRSLGIPDRFVQDNQTYSRRGVLRGMHYQLGRPQAKLVRVLAGEVFDVAVDCRRGSPTFGQWVGERLSAENRRMLFLPEGFAHGFFVISDGAEVLYKCSDVWLPEAQRAFHHDDPRVGIAWPIPAGINVIVREQDRKAPLLGELGADDLPPYRP
jgi:dTDP-4-dehydrorhamnose 3,5-epimerase